MLPTEDEIRRAFEAGFATIDEGIGFYPGFHAALVAGGYQRPSDAPCTCPDRGAHGHLPECGWIRGGSDGH